MTANRGRITTILHGALNSRKGFETERLLNTMPKKHNTTMLQTNSNSMQCCNAYVDAFTLNQASSATADEFRQKQRLYEESYSNLINNFCWSSSSSWSKATKETCNLQHDVILLHCQQPPPPPQLLCLHLCQMQYLVLILMLLLKGATKVCTTSFFSASSFFSFLESSSVISLSTAGDNAPDDTEPSG